MADSNTSLAEPATIPQSVNYHFTRQCNYQCGFCFHTAKTSFVLPIDEAKRGLQMLKDAGNYYVICTIYNCSEIKISINVMLSDTSTVALFRMNLSKILSNY